MGAEDGDKDARPVHDVEVAAFCLDKTEVTMSAFESCASEGKCKAAGKNIVVERRANVAADVVKVQNKGCNARDSKRGEHPVNCVDWEQARAYCEAKGGRLPTEEEWEYAARGGDEARKFPWGPKEPTGELVNAFDLKAKEWWKSNGQDALGLVPWSDGYATTAPVGSFPAGAGRWGHLDLAGNVKEWTESAYRKSYESDAETKNRVFRGGGCGFTKVAALQGSARGWGDPTVATEDLGFRCAAALIDGGSDAAPSSPATSGTSAPDSVPPAAVSAAAASAEATEESKPTTVSAKLDALLARAMEVKEFEKKIERNEWAFFPTNAVGCGGGMRDDGTEFDKRIDLPDTSNEFELKRLLDKKDEIKKSLVDSIVKMQDSHRIEPKNYDFKKKSFQFRVGNSSDSSTFDRWPFPGGEPKFSRESFTMDGKADTGLRIGGKKVEVNTQEEIATYNNVSAMPLTVSVEPEQAELWSKSGVELKYVFVQQFKGVGFHKACKFSCSVIFGTRVCSNDNQGKGPYYKTVALGHRVWLDGKIVAEAISEK